MNFNRISGFLITRDRFLPDLDKTFEEDYFLNKKANFYKKLSDLIKEFTIE